MNSELCEPILDIYIVFYVFLICGSAVIVTIVIFHQDYFMTNTLNFGIVSLFLKGGYVTVGSAAGSGSPYRSGTRSTSSSVVASTAHHAMPGRSLYYDMLY